MIGLLTLLLACADAPPEPECRDDGDCVGLSECTPEGTCAAVECLESAHCPLEHRCTAERACEPGCDGPGDCVVGDVCEAGACVPAACADSQLDCWPGDVCDLDLGACVQEADLCAPCAGEGWAACRDEIGGECRYFGEYYCLPPCDPATDPAKLPRGFACLDVSGNDSGRYRLWGDCRDVVAHRAEDLDTDTSP